jgi:hypothetical protein
MTLTVTGSMPNWIAVDVFSTAASMMAVKSA